MAVGNIAYPRSDGRIGQCPMDLLAHILLAHSMRKCHAANKRTHTRNRMACNVGDDITAYRGFLRKFLDDSIYLKMVDRRVMLGAAGGNHAIKIFVN